MKRAFFLLNAVLSMAILNFISLVLLLLFVTCLPNSRNIPHYLVVFDELCSALGIVETCYTKIHVTEDLKSNKY